MVSVETIGRDFDFVGNWIDCIFFRFYFIFIPTIKISICKFILKENSVIEGFWRIFEDLRYIWYRFSLIIILANMKISHFFQIWLQTWKKIFKEVLKTYFFHLVKKADRLIPEDFFGTADAIYFG